MPLNIFLASEGHKSFAIEHIFTQYFPLKYQQ